MQDTTQNYNKPRQLSNKKNIIKIISGILLILLTALCFLLKTLLFTDHIIITTIDLLSIMTLVIGIRFFLLGINNYIYVNSTNKYLSNLPYGFDEDEEIAKYKSIGRQSKKKKNVKPYANYSAWKSYIEEAHATKKENKDFYRFLNRKLRNAKDSKESTISILTPISIAFITIFCTIEITRTEISIEKPIEIVCYLIFLATMFTILTVEITKTITEQETRIYFLEDFIEIVFPDIIVDENSKK